MPTSKSESERTMQTRARLYVAGLLSALFLAAAVAFGTGLGERAVGWFDSPETPVTFSAAEQVFECGTPLFIPDPQAEGILAGIPPGDDWNKFKESNQGSVASQSVVEVSIQGESDRVVTLTGVELEVDRSARPAGGVFASPCGDGLVGRYLSYDLDERPPLLLDSSSDPEAEIGAFDRDGEIPYERMTFPWTVSLTDPLLIKIMAGTQDSASTWRAHITWRSGAQEGVLTIDNDGKGYDVVGGDDLPKYVYYGDEIGWERLEP